MKKLVVSYLLSKFALKMQIGYDAKRYFHNKTGLGNYSRTLVKDIGSLYPDDVEQVLYDSKAVERTFRLGHKAKEDGCDLFHGLSNELPRDIKSAGIPSIVTMHDVAWRTFPDMYKPIDRLIYDWKYGWSARHATHVVCISESTKSDVMKFYGVPEERISVIYQPVQRLFYTPMSKEQAEHILQEKLSALSSQLSASFILTVGSINSRKNLLGMVQALERIKEEERPLFVVIGNGREYRQKVEQYIDEHHLRKWIRIETDIHDGEILQALYTKALCLLYPSFYEGFGLPVVEASLQHCPVITSNISSLPEAAGPGAIQVNPHMVGEIAYALLRVLRDNKLREKMGKEGHDYCMSNFAPEVLTKQMYQLYEKVIKG